MPVVLSTAHAPADLQAVIARLEAVGWRIDEMRINPRPSASHSPNHR